MTAYEQLVKALRIHTTLGVDCDECSYYDDCRIHGNGQENMIKDAAAAIEELQAQLPKRGKWLNVTDSYSWYGKCSVCGEEFVVDAYYAGGMNYCPNCGARMEVQDG